MARLTRATVVERAAELSDDIGLFELTVRFLLRFALLAGVVILARDPTGDWWR